MDDSLNMIESEVTTFLLSDANKTEKLDFKAVDEIAFFKNRIKNFTSALNHFKPSTTIGHRFWYVHRAKHSLNNIFPTQVALFQLNYTEGVS